VVRQLSFSTGFKAFPHDLWAVAPNKFYVTRNSTNSSPTADRRISTRAVTLDLDLDLGEAVGRIDLAPYAAADWYQSQSDRGPRSGRQDLRHPHNFSADMVTQLGQAACRRGPDD